MKKRRTATSIFLLHVEAFCWSALLGLVLGLVYGVSKPGASLGEAVAVGSIVGSGAWLSFALFLFFEEVR